MRPPFSPAVEAALRKVEENANLATGLEVSPSWIGWLLHGGIKLKEAHYEKVQAFFAKHGVSDFRELRRAADLTFESVDISELPSDKRALVLDLVKEFRNEAAKEAEVIAWNAAHPKGTLVIVHSTVGDRACKVHGRTTTKARLSGGKIVVRVQHSGSNDWTSIDVLTFPEGGAA